MKKTIDAYAEDLANRPAGISPYTIKGYLSDLKQFTTWFEKATGEPMRLRNVTPIDIREYKRFLQKERKLKPATINRHIAALRSYFDWGVVNEWIRASPVQVSIVEEPDTGPRSIDDRTYFRLLRTVQKYGSTRDVAIVQLLRHTGLRVGELCSLELSDIEMSERKGRVVVRSGKGRRYREIPLNLDVRKSIISYLEVRPETEAQNVFIGQRKNGLKETAVQDIVRKYAKLAELEDVTPHVLRHTFAKGLLNRGVDLVTVKMLMGHRRLDSTARYTKPTRRDLEVAVSRLELEE